mgnify:CR=1 FL=1
MARTKNETLTPAAFLAAAASLAATSSKCVRPVVGKNGKVKKTAKGKVMTAVKPTADEAKAWLLSNQSVLSAVVSTAKAAKDNAEEQGDRKAMKGEAKIVVSKFKTLETSDKKLVAIATKQMKRALNLKQLSKVFASYLR